MVEHSLVKVGEQWLERDVYTITMVEIQSPKKLKSLCVALITTGILNGWQWFSARLQASAFQWKAFTKVMVPHSEFNGSPNDFKSISKDENVFLGASCEPLKPLA